MSLLTTELELALRRPRDPGELTAALRSALEETDRLSRLAHDLLMLAPTSDHAPGHHGGASGTTRSARVTMLAPVLAATVARYHPRTGSGDVVLDCRPDLTVHADPDDLVRAVSNLLENALRHGRVPITLTARPRPAAGTGDGDGDGEMVDIAVRDHAAAAAGAGMALVGAARTPAERQTSSRRCGPAPQRVEATRAVLGCHLPTCAHRWQASRATRTTTTASHKNFSDAADQYR